MSGESQDHRTGERGDLSKTERGHLTSNERGGIAPNESGDFIPATYREIAAQFHLGGPNAARTKVKRAGWSAEPTNHPADPLRIRVPRDAWYQEVDTPHLEQQRDGPDLTPRRDAPSQKRDTHHIKALEGHITTLQEELGAERLARVAAQEQRDQALADVRAERDRADRAEKSRDEAIARADAADGDRRAADARSDATLALADRTLGQLSDAGTRIDRLECDLADALTAADVARAEAREAQSNAAELRQADAARRARGRWARLRAAWRGE